MPDLLQHGAHRLSGLPEGEDARYIARLAQAAWDSARAPIMHIVLDDARLHTMCDLLVHFAPDVAVIAFPAWDCLPYDRVSPQPDITAQRVRALQILCQENPWQGPTVIVTPLNAAIQKLPPQSAFQKSSYILQRGKEVDRQDLLDYLTAQGYLRADTVRESGEYSVRGSLLDIFPAGDIAPVRIDFFDNEIETIKIFDPMQQTSLEAVEHVTLLPTAEVQLNKETIAHFRQKYRELFGAQQGDDPLFEAISAGQRYPGMEHWLPLFYPETQTLFDLVPERAPLLLDHQLDAAYAERMGQVMDFYNARQAMIAEKPKNNPGSYKPVPPPSMFVMETEWQSALKARAIVRQLSPFAGAENEADLGAIPAPHFSALANNNPAELYERLRNSLQQWQNEKKKIIFACYSDVSLERLRKLCDDHNIPAQKIDFVLLSLEHGFVAADMVVLTEQDILGDRLTRAPKKKRRNQDVFANVSELTVGDLVVHAEHGIGRFDGLITLTLDDAAHDCVRILYADNDKLFVPVENLDVLSRFGSDHATAQLDKLGGAGWQSRKARIKKRLLDMAEGLIAIAAQRKTAQAPEIEAPEGTFQEFVARFPYQETDDQERAIFDVLNDLHNGTVMDRLVCGDVGFGKTEVAMRAAFVAAMAGLQVAVVVPTTLLARQHFANFTKRFAGFPLKIGQLSRMVTAKDAAQTRDWLGKGQLDIVIGTHAVLAEKVKFHNLGLLIIDEEQNFGVKQKEKLKSLKENVHVLTLTATPIPRTLQLAMTGIRDLSLIATPPVDRLAVRTAVMPFDPVIIREAILREYYRGGQCFYVVPRLSDMKDVQEMIEELVPEIRIIQAHGQMSPTDLDERMTAFYEGQYHLLLATNIIESGLDIPNANTLIVHRSDLFGLGQLYQIRGRIGRSKRRAYAYITYKDDKLLSEAAKKRLQVIGTLDTLGAGFQLASYDMDIRGAGNLLGEEQSGHIKEVGVELYQQMLEEAVQAVKSGAGHAIDSMDLDWTPNIQLGLPVLIPDNYIVDLPVRLSLYRRLASLTTQEDMDAFATELIDRFGPLPPEVENLLQVMTLKHLCKLAGIEKLEAGPKGGVVAFRKNQFKAVEKLLVYVHGQMGTVKIRPDQKLSIARAWDDVAIRVKGVRAFVNDLASMVG